jgi:hypothetical protein
MIGLVHLVWAPLGPEPLRAFLRSYRAHPAGAEHELVIVLNGARNESGPVRHAAGQPHGAKVQAHASVNGAALSREDVLADLQGTAHRLIELTQPLQDLAAYGEAARRLEHEWLCLLNSYSVVLADDWLGMLARATEQPGVGLAGATGSWESQAEWTRGHPRVWARQLSTVRGARRDYPRFPNPHMRTTALMIDRETALGFDLRQAYDKRAAYLLESGRQSITRQILQERRRAVVVGRDGRAYEIADWPHSRTYRAGEQDNLLVADNRTEDWRRATPRMRRRLSRDAWGTARP